MKPLIFIITLTFFISCQTNNPEKKQEVLQVDPCLNLKDTFSSVSIFSKSKGILPTRDFYDVIKFIESKGYLKLTLNKNTQNKVDFTNDIILIHHIDSCNDKLVTQKFIFKNATSTSCIFRSTVKLSGSKNYYPGFVFSQWNFANNLERDSAYKIMSWVYANGD